MLKRPVLAAVVAAAIAAAPAAALAAVPTGLTAHLGPIRQLGQPPAPQRYVFSFNLHSFKITNTRSLHVDSDYVVIAVGVGNQTPIVLPALLMGDLNNGDFPVPATIPNITVPAGANVTFSYLILNTSADPAAVQKLLDGFMMNTAQVEEGRLPETVIGRHASEWQIKTIGFTGCDGSVAAAHHGFTAAQLFAAAETGAPIGGTDDNPGNDSAGGCGGNSQYAVTWSVVGAAAP